MDRHNRMKIEGIGHLEIITEMNILLVNMNMGESRAWGGIESHSAVLASLLSGRGHNVIIACRSEGSVKVSGGLVLPSRRITMRNSGDIRAMMKLMKIIRRDRIDIVIANLGLEYWPAAVAALLHGIRIVFVRHQVDRIRATTRWLIRNHIDAVIAVSNAVQDALLKSGIPAEKIEVVHNSISLKKFDPRMVDRDHVRRELGFEADAIVIGMAGKLDRGKGVFELVHAVSRIAHKYPKLKLLFIGDGSDRSSLEEETRRLTLHDRVIFAGVRIDIEQMYAAMDVFVLPSTCQEAFGMVLIEAMAMGKPVIGTNVGGIPEIVENGISGALITPGDVSSLAEAISRYIDDSLFAKRMAEEGRKTVERNFSEWAMCECFERILFSSPEKKARRI